MSQASNICRRIKTLFQKLKDETVGWCELTHSIGSDQPFWIRRSRVIGDGIKIHPILRDQS